MEIIKNNVALILGLFETGLGVGRSLGRASIKVYGFDYKKDIGFYSKYINATKCPHPIEGDLELLNFLITFSKKQKYPPVLFITSDDFLIYISKHQVELKKHYLFNIPSEKLIEQISNKYEQYKLVSKTNVSLPFTLKISNISDIERALKENKYPVFVKALDVNKWREVIGGTIKGFVIDNKDELDSKLKLLLDKGLEIIVQEIIPGPDNKHYKYCFYSDKKGAINLEFTLQKIRQNPIHYGVGASVESIKYEELLIEGRKLVKSISYNGIGSAEFKYDYRDGKLKLIELNPRYWQQNSLPTACGMNFPLTDYLMVTGQNTNSQKDFIEGIKWINIYADFSSFIQYNKIGQLNLKNWYRSLKGRKIYSDFSMSDIIPFFYEFRFGLKFFRLPIYLYKKFLK